MERKVFLSFLGATRYLPSKYYVNKENIIENRFVQIASLFSHCQDFGKDDYIYIFTTPTAKKKNWEDFFWEDKKETTKGLKSELDKSNLKCNYEAIDIDEETSEEKIWETFDIVFKKLKNYDEIVFDITHGFRSSPMLLMVLINYAKFLKNITVRKILYGAYEARNENNETKIWDLTNFALLQDWTSASNEFLNFGNSTSISKLTKNEAIPFIKSNTEKKEIAKKISLFASELNKFTTDISTVRGYEIYLGKTFVNIRNIIKEIEQLNFIQPLGPLLNAISKKIEPFKANYIFNILKIVDFCINHNMTQQGITFLQEAIISFVLKNNNLEWFFSDSGNKKTIINNRDLASSVLNYIENIKNPSFVKEGWNWKYWDKQIIDTLLQDVFVSKISDIYSKLGKFRNDINHGGLIEKFNSDKFLNTLKKSYSDIIELISEDD